MILGINQIIISELGKARIRGRRGIAALVESIRTEGQLVPITVIPSSKPDQFVLVDGYRRYSAIEQLGIDHIEANIVDHAHTGKVTELPVADIQPNPHNPRRLFDEEPMAVLLESIRALGILVPITAYESTVQGKYILLDGERRWRCANQLSLYTAPAIVVERPDDVTNILTMFHIHNVREGWQLMPTALKLKQLIESLGESNERVLHELTQLTIS